MDARLPVDRGPVEAGVGQPGAGRRERELFVALELPERSQLEWLAARTAGQGVRRRAAACHARARAAACRDRDPARRAGRTGRASAPRWTVSAEAPVVSLTHTHGQAAALAAFAPPGRCASASTSSAAVPRPQGFAQAALYRHRAAAARAVLRSATEEWLLRIWCAREAAGQGARHRPRRRHRLHRVCPRSTPSARHVLVDVGDPSDVVALDATATATSSTWSRPPCSTRARRRHQLREAAR